MGRSIQRVESDSVTAGVLCLTAGWRLGDHNLVDPATELFNAAILEDN